MDHAGILAVFSVNIEAHTGGIAYNSSNSKCLTITVSLLGRTEKSSIVTKSKLSSIMRLNNSSLLPLTITIIQYCDLLGLLDTYPCIVLSFKPSSMLFIIRITHNLSSFQYLIGGCLVPLSNLSHLRTHTGFTIPRGENGAKLLALTTLNADCCADWLLLITTMFGCSS